MRSVLVVCCLALLVAGFVGCASNTLASAGSGSGGTAPEWVDDPASIADKFAVVGMAPCANPMMRSSSRNFAEQDGRAKLAAFLKTQVNALVENWSKQVADLMRPDNTFSSYINNEMISRGLTDATIAGARPAKYWYGNGNEHVLMVLDKPEDWLLKIADTYEQEALRDETLWKTQAMKDDFRNKMDTLRKENTEKVQSMKYGPPPAAPAPAPAPAPAANP